MANNRYDDELEQRRRSNSNGTKKKASSGTRRTTTSANGTRKSSSGNTNRKVASSNGAGTNSNRPVSRNAHAEEVDRQIIEAQTPSKKKRQSQKAKRRKRRRIILAIEIVALIIVIALLYFWSKMSKITYNTIGTTEKNELSESATEILRGYENIALFGLDNRQAGVYENGRSDTIMVASINNDTKEVKLISVYRDTLLDTTGNGNLTKANAAYNKGPESAINMLNRNLDLDITDYITVDFTALVKVVDALGGIELTIDSEDLFNWMNYAYIPECEELTGISSGPVEMGTQTVDGIQALAYCRVRYLAGGDFARASHQRIVVEQIIAKAKLASPAQLSSMIDAMFENIDTSFTAAQLISLASQYSSYTLAGTSGFPFDMATGTFDGTGSVDVPCTLESNVSQLYEYLYGETDYEPSEKVQELSLKIKNITGYTEENSIDYGY